MANNNVRFVAKNGLDNNYNTIINLGSSGSSLGFSGGNAVTFTTTGTTALTLPTSGTLLTTAGTAAFANNLSGGSAGALVYQSSAGATAYLTAGTSSQVLVGGSTPAWTGSPSLTSITLSGNITADSVSTTMSSPNPATTRLFVNAPSSQSAPLARFLISSTDVASIGADGTITGSSFTGAGTGLTGTAASLSIGGSAYSLQGYLPSTVPGNSTIVLRDSAGNVYAKYLNQFTNNDENPTISQVMVTNGADSYLRKSSIAYFSSALTGTASGLSIGGSAGSAAASSLTGTTLASNVVNSSLTSVGTITTGTWNATPISNTYLANSSVTVTAGTGLSGGGSVSLGGTITITNAGVTSLAGTTNQVVVSASTGAITLSLPQNINSGAAPTFAGTNFSSIPNGALTNSSLTIGSTNISLGATTSSLAGLSSVSATTFTGALTGHASLDLSLSGGTLTGPLILAADPVTGLGAATKNYVDAAIAGLSWKQEVLCATTANITLSGEQTIDGVTTSSSRVLVKNQTTASQNGIYISSSGAWTRSTDSTTGAQILNSAIYVDSGTTQSITGWVNSNTGSITVGTTAITYVQFSGAGSYVAGTGLTLSGNTFSITTGGVSNSLLTNSSLTINGTAISLGGSGTVTAAAGTLTGTTLASNVVNSSLTSVGTLSSLTVSGAITATGGVIGNVTGSSSLNVLKAGDTMTGSLTMTTGNPTYGATSNSSTGVASFQAISSDNNATLLARMWSASASNVNFGQTLANWATVYTPISSTTSNGLIVGTSNATPILFGTNSTERMRIDSSGHVGIGTTAPTRQLSVGNATDEVGANVSSSISTLYLGGSQASTGVFTLAYDRSAGNTIFSNGNVSPGTMTERMRIDNSGNVGIGVTPSGRLDVAGTTSTFPGRTIITDDGGYLPTITQYKWSGAGSNYYGFRQTLFGGDATWSTAPTAAIGSGTFTERMRLTSSGLVGIGRTPTTWSLEVVGGISTYTNGSTGGLYMTDNGNTNRQALSLDTDNLYRFGSYTSGFKFFTLDTERMRIDSTGRVGIGTTLPQGIFEACLTDSTTTTAPIVATLTHKTTGTVASGFGATLQFTLQDASGALINTNSIASGWTNAASGSRQSALVFYNGQSNAQAEAMRIDTNGNLMVGVASGPQGIITAKGTIAAIDSSQSYIASMYASSGISIISAYSATGQALAFYTTTSGSGAAERMRIDSAGNVGIGTIPTSGWGQTVIQFNGSALAANGTGPTLVQNGVYTGSVWKYISGGNLGLYSIQNSQGHIWQSAVTGTAGATATMNTTMQLDTSGNLSTAGNAAFGTTSNTTVTIGVSGTSGGGGTLQIGGATSQPSLILLGNGTGTSRITMNSSTSNDIQLVGGGTSATTTITLNNNLIGATLLSFQHSSTTIGSITKNGATSILYNTTSDLRLKENIQPAESFGNVIDKIDVVSFDWRGSTEHQRAGMIAQNLYEIVPEAVKKGDTNETITDTWGVDYSKLVPMLVKEIQELRARVASLEASRG